jgi:glycosyltransferase involved in cell wall biosynthesis
MIKVLYIIDSLKAYGAEKSLALLSSSFNVIQPVFISLNSNLELKPFLEANGIKVYSDIEKGKSENKLLNTISHIIEIEKPSIIHSTLFKSDLISRKLKLRYPEIILVGSLVSNSYSKNRYKTLSIYSKLKLFSTQLKDRMSIKLVDHFVSNSKAIVKSNCKALGLPINKINVIHRGRSIPVIQTEEISSIKRLYEGKKVFLTVGRLCKNKGQLDLINVFKKLNLSALNIVLLIIGDGPDYAKLKNEIRRCNLQDYVYLLGYQENVQYFYEIADFFIFPSYFEGLPGALIEAIFAKVPCIVSNIPENRECLTTNGGLYFEPGNFHQIKSKVEEAIELNNWREKVEENYNYALKYFTLEQAAKNYEEFYLSLI